MSESAAEAQVKTVNEDPEMIRRRVIDGLQTPRYKADVGIKDGRIARIGQISANEADEVLDGEGLFTRPAHNGQESGSLREIHRDR